MAGENSTCSIENYPDFTEPREISFTSVEQIIPTLREIGTQGLYQRRKDLEQELESIKFQQIIERGVAENGIYQDVNSGLRGIAIQAEICGLNAQIQQLEQNTSSLLDQAKEIAKSNESEFGLFKNYILGVISGEMGLIWLRIIFLGEENAPEDDSYVNILVEHYISYIDFFGITQAELRQYISRNHGLDELHDRIQNFQFSDL